MIRLKNNAFALQRQPLLMLLLLCMLACVRGLAGGRACVGAYKPSVWRHTHPGVAGLTHGRAYSCETPTLAVRWLAGAVRSPGRP